MDLALAFDDVLRITQTALDPRAGWSALVRYLEGHAKAALPELASVDIGSDVTEVRRQLGDLLDSEPPPADVDAFYFGLFDALDDAEQEVIGYYVAGVVGFDPEDGDTLCGPAWWPDGRYLESAALAAIKGIERSAGASGQADLRALAGYAGQLGAALLVSRFASEGLLPTPRLVVGFDEGDFAVLGG